MYRNFTLNDAAATTQKESDLSRRLSALGHPARLEILRHLAADDGRCCKDVVGALDLAQSTVSQHLKVLVDAGLVHLFVEGKRSRYCLNRAAWAALQSDFNALLAGSVQVPPMEPRT
jgi:ArsR family transcriptional regulator, arsenate/arsenite/antimonite-responsive transcriptional repressor